MYIIYLCIKMFIYLEIKNIFFFNFKIRNIYFDVLWNNLKKKCFDLLNLNGYWYGYKKWDWEKDMYLYKKIDDDYLKICMYVKLLINNYICKIKLLYIWIVKIWKFYVKYNISEILELVFIIILSNLIFLIKKENYFRLDYIFKYC